MHALKRIGGWCLRGLVYASAVALLGTITQVSRAANPETIVVNYQPTPSGHINSKYQDGNDGTVLTPLTFDDQALSAISCTVGSVSSFNVLSHLDHPVSGTTTIVVEPPDPLVAGVSFDGTSLNCSAATVAGSATYYFRARYPASPDALSKGSVLTIQAAPSSDVTPPTQPVALLGSSASGTVTLSWLPSADPYDGTRAGNLDHYEVLRNGAHLANVTAPASLSPVWSQSILGSYSPTPTSSQTLGSYSFTSAGAGIHATATEEAIYRHTQVSGDRLVGGRVTAFTSAFQYSTGAITGFYGSMAVGAPFFVCYFEPTSPGNGVQCKSRLTQGGTSANVTAGVPSTNAPRCLFVDSVGTTFTGYYSNNINCSELTVIGSQQVPAILATKEAVVGLSSQNAGVAESITVDQLAVVPNTRVTYTFADTGTNSYTVRAVDLAGNNSGATPGVSVVATASAANQIHFHAGHGITSESVMLAGIKGYSDSFITELNGTDFIHWEQLVGWTAIEGAQGSYDFTLLDALYSLAAANHVNLVLQIFDRNFSGSSTSAGGRLPSYLNGLGCSYVKQGATGTSGGAILKWWDGACVDRLIALYQAIGAHFDDGAHPYFEGVMTSESDLGFTQVPAGFTSSTDFYNTYMAQLQRFLSTAVRSFPRTNLWESANDIPTGKEAVPAFLDFLIANRVGISAPDVHARCSTVRPDPMCVDDFVLVMNGYRWNGTAFVAGAGASYIGRIARAHDMEISQMGGKAGSFAASVLYDYALNKNFDSHLWAARKTVPNGTLQQLCYKNAVGTCAGGSHYTPDWFTYINGAGKPLVTTCPSEYTGGCYTGH